MTILSDLCMWRDVPNRFSIAKLINLSKNSEKGEMSREKSHQGISGGRHRKLAGVGSHSNNLERDVKVRLIFKREIEKSGQVGLK